MAAVIGQLRLGQRRRLGYDDGRTDERQHVAARAPGGLRGVPDRVHMRPHRRMTLPVEEHAFRMRPGENPAPARRPGLEQHRRPLRRRLAEVHRLHAEMRPVMPDRPHQGRVREPAAVPVAQHGALRPTSFPQPIDRLHEIVGDVVAVVVRALPVLAHRARRAVQIAGDDVPADPSAREMVQRGHAAGEGERRFVAEIDGDAEAEIARGRRHGGDEEQRIADRDLHCMLDRRRRAAAMHVIDAEDVGEEQAIEQAAFRAAARARSSGRGWCIRPTGPADDARAPAGYDRRSSCRSPSGGSVSRLASRSATYLNRPRPFRRKIYRQGEQRPCPPALELHNRRLLKSPPDCVRL